MPVYTGSAAEQWTQAGIDVALGRITVQELHALGLELFHGEASEQRLLAEIEELEERVEELRCYEDDAEDLEGKVKKLKRKVKELKGENKALKATIATLESRSRPEGYES